MKLLIKLFGKNAFVSGGSYEKKANYTDYYLITSICKNCNQTTIIYVKKGVHLNDIIAGIKCRNCECRLEKI